MIWKNKKQPAINEKGMTLIELIIVMAFIAVLSAIAVPMYIDNIPRFQLKAAARNLVADFQKTKMEAVKRNCDVDILFTTGTYSEQGEVGSYQIVDTNSGDVLLRRAMPKYVSLYSTNLASDESGYDSQGLPTSASGSIFLRNNKTTFYKVSISAAGNVSLTISSTDPS